ncbi:MAG: hypothetical protein RLZZ463_45 [Bacteroidota bacterium]
MELKNLQIGYCQEQGTQYLSGPLTMTFQPGQLIGIVGVNGVGKSTLLRTLSGIQPPLAGEVTINNAPVARWNAKKWSHHVSLITAKHETPPVMTVREIASMGRYPHLNWWGTLTPKDQEIVRDVLAYLGLSAWADQPAELRSDGQKQLIHLARAIVQQTPYLLLDEPTTHLDLHHGFQLWKWLKSIAAKGDKTIILTTHDIEKALTLCDQILVMQHEKADWGTPDTLVDSGIFDNLFDSNLVTFDPNTRQFKMR